MEIGVIILCYNFLTMVMLAFVMPLLKGNDKFCHEMFRFVKTTPHQTIADGVGRIEYALQAETPSKRRIGGKSGGQERAKPFQDVSDHGKRQKSAKWGRRPPLDFLSFLQWIFSFFARFSVQCSKETAHNLVTSLAVMFSFGPDVGLGC